MKLSMQWIFDYLKADYTEYNAQDIAHLLTKKVAEVEDVYAACVNSDHLYSIVITQTTGTNSIGYCHELETEIVLTKRAHLIIGHSYLIKKEKDSFCWATYTDWNLEKDGFLPAFFLSESERDGSWKQTIEYQDFIFEIHNKSITHRPDLWSHQGFARELALLLDIQLKDEKEFLYPAEIISISDVTKKNRKIPIKLHIKDAATCKKLAACYLPVCNNQPSLITMAYKLAKVGAKSLNLIVDLTNYVMFDIGQPMHAYDASYFDTKVLEVGYAKNGHTLALLDKTQTELTNQDIVVTDGKKPVALAGVMGSQESSIVDATSECIIEAGTFNATMVRKSAAYHKVRTEASARFEKTLNTYTPVKALQRFIQLAIQVQPAIANNTITIIQAGQTEKPNKIKLAHDVIEKKLGITLPQAFVTKTLEQLGFCVTLKKGEYDLVIPYWRSSKDITLQEDVIEEVARIYGYDTLTEQLPAFTTQPKNHTYQQLQMQAKQYFAFAAHMHEVENYALFDNDFLTAIGYKIGQSVLLKNPLTQQRTTLVTSLIPHLLQNVVENKSNHETLRFFEIASVWAGNSKKVTETKKISGIFYHKKKIDFYDCKKILTDFFTSFSVDVKWKKQARQSAWASKHQTADLYAGSKKIGSAGMVSSLIMAKLKEGQAFCFEIDFNALIAKRSLQKEYIPFSKYQETSLDISMMVPLAVTVADLKKSIALSDPLITKVALLDQFHKPEWQDSKSITLRFFMQDPHQTLSKEIINAGYTNAVKAVTSKGAVVR